MPITINLNLKYINMIGSILTDLIAIIVKIEIFFSKSCPYIGVFLRIILKKINKKLKK